MSKTRRKLALIVFIMMASLCSVVQASGVTITIAGQATIRGPQITFGELADIQGGDEARIASLRNLKLGAAPPPGESVLWSADALGVRLAATGADLADISWQVPPSVTITTDAQRVSADLLVATALAALRQRLGQAVDSGDITINLHGEVRDLAAPLGVLRLTPTQPKAIRYTMPTAVPVNVSVDDRLFLPVNISFDIALFRDVVIVGRDVAAHEMLTLQDLHMQRLEVGQQPAGYITDTARAIGFAARRALTPGTILTETLLEKPFLVRRGDAVTILAQSGSLEVSVPGQALQDGKAGQFIRVQNNHSAKIIVAQVLDASTVLVH